MLARRKAEASLGRGAPAIDRPSRAALGLRRQRAGARHLPAGRAGQRNAAPGCKSPRLGATRQSWTARTIWEAPADPAFPGRGFYVLVDGSDLAQNEHVTADGAGRRGRSRRHGARRCAGLWRERSLGLCPDRAGKLPARRHRYRKAMRGGYFVPQASGIQAGQEMVTSGAGLLLARETQSQHRSRGIKHALACRSVRALSQAPSRP